MGKWMREKKETPTRKINNRIDKAICREVLEALKEARGNRMEAARLLGVSRGTLYNYIERFQIVVEKVAPSAPMLRGE